MPFISVTRLRVRSLLQLPAFFKANEASVKRLEQSTGFLGGSELIDRGLTFWTLTVWEDAAAMQQFRNSPEHRHAMQQLPHWCSEGSYHHWEQEDYQIPAWAAASEKLLNEGRLTKVRQPTAQQKAGRFPPIRWTKLVRPFKAKN